MLDIKNCVCNFLKIYLDSVISGISNEHCVSFEVCGHSRGIDKLPEIFAHFSELAKRVVAQFVRVNHVQAQIADVNLPLTDYFLNIFKLFKFKNSLEVQKSAP